MPKLSAGLLPYRFVDDTLQLFLVHPGGPFWAKKDDQAWSVSKGEYEEEDDAKATAEREFQEELGMAAPEGPRIDLGEIRQPSGKRICVWAIEADGMELHKVVSNEFQMEWPPKSGKIQSFPEVDRAEWMSAARARHKLVKGQVGFIDRLIDELQNAGAVSFSEGDGEPSQSSLFE